ncbi:MAG TPA: DUF1003 domain-containing protein [Candidatus Nanoarchaeia archaeon]|nr:DUF1003 domain-containing protein [Candidatus Nanoarchaeia archaeon]
MPKTEEGRVKKKTALFLNGEHHPRLTEELSLGQKAADIIASFGGSWTFISIFLFILFAWMIFNTIYLLNKAFDPYPYILLNLVLSCLAALQAPIILMAQNRQTERDRLDAKYDHAVNRKAEREIQVITRELNNIKLYLRQLKR